jgi:Outer membrane protein beta-barrel domain
VRAIHSCACAAALLSTVTLAALASAGPAVGADDTTADAQAEADAPALPDAGSPEDAAVVVDASPLDAAPTDDAAAAKPLPAATARAGAPDEGSGPSGLGFTGTLRGGYALPFGDAKNVAHSDVVQHSFPIGIEAGYFFNPHLYVGVYGLYGFATNGNASSDCSDPNNTCSANQIRFGGTVHWHFTPHPNLSPWVGVGLGYDVVNITATDSSGTDVSSGSIHGFEASLLAGLDYKPLRYLGVGPFVELSMGHYAGADTATSLYEWLAFGLRFRTGL